MHTEPNKRPRFTLIEMLIVITLIATALGALSIQLPKLWKSEQFQRGVDHVITQLTLAQELMLDFRTDVTIKFYKEEESKEIICEIITHKPLPPRVEKRLRRYAHIKGIDTLAFNDSVEPIVLDFDGTLGRSPEGKLTLGYRNREESIILKGYPSQIKRGEHEETPPREALYPQECLSFI